MKRKEGRWKQASEKTNFWKDRGKEIDGSEEQREGREAGST